MADEVHEVVELLTARMKSHPEEFRVADAPFHDRWYDHVNSINAYGNEADKAALATGLREIRLAETHEQVMDELLNGDERRRKEEEEQEYGRNLLKSNLAQQQNAMQRYQNAIGQQQLQQYQNAASGTALLGKSPTSVILDEYANIGTVTASQPELSLSSSAINQIKKALKL
jgi:hypothetical protein